MTLNSRQELILFQQDIYQNLKRLAHSLQTRKTAFEKHYEVEYETEVQHYERIATKEELLRDLAQSTFAYFADYHTLRQSQKIPVWVLSRLLEQKKMYSFHHPLFLTLEMFHSKDQPWIDQYLAGTLTEKDFLEVIHYSKTWGFHWEHYKKLLDFARAHAIPVIGLNGEFKSSYQHLFKRDRHAARILVHLLQKNPQALFITVYGELHLATAHLPFQVQRLLIQKKLENKSHVLIYQNSESIYWDLVRRRLENNDLVKIKEQTYCVMNTTPLVRLQSYINWQKREEELRCSLHPNWCEVGESLIDLVDEVSDLIRQLCHFWELPPTNLDDLSVYTTHNLDFIERSLQNVLDRNEIEKIKIQLSRQESYFLPWRHTIFLTNLSINHAAEEAMHYLHLKQIHLNQDPTLSAKDSFYFRILYEAIGFLGSKIINPKRKCYKIKDFQDFLLQTQHKRLRDSHLREVRRISQYVLKHRQREETYLQSGRWIDIPHFYTMSFPYFTSVSHALGYMLGDYLFSGLTQNQLSKKEIKNAFQKNIHEPHQSLPLYLHLLHQIQSVQESYLSRDDIL